MHEQMAKVYEATLILLSNESWTQDVNISEF